MSCLSHRFTQWLTLVIVLVSCFEPAATRSMLKPDGNWLRKALQRRNKVHSEASFCASKAASNVSPPKANVWWGLTDIEIANVTGWLFDQTDLNLTTHTADDWANTVLLVELMRPNKSDVLPYLDGDGPAPTRWAHVVLDHRATLEPYYQDILVGPLPVKNETTWMPLDYPYTRKTLGKIRNLDADETSLYTQWLYKISHSILDITLDLWNGSALGLENDTLDIFGIDPLWQEDGIIRWDTFWQLPKSGFDSETLMPLGLFFKSNVTGRDVSKWSLDGWLYNNIFYDTTEDFRKAYKSKGFVKLPPVVEGTWVTSNQRGPILPFDASYPPVSVSPTGSRYYVNQTERYVKWMDFSFYLSFNRDTGMQLYDIRYKGKRIIYELGLQEALAHYAGNDPVQSGTAYLDTFYGFGTYSFQLVKGYDCPTYATYMNSSFYVDETTRTHIDSICMFEMDAGYPIQRHTTSSYVSVTKNIFFTVRHVSTVGNYDYMLSYEFYMDGSIHVEVRASGYIQAAYWANNEEYGYHIHDALSGSMHDHVLNYKIDFDILGTQNTVQATTNIPVSQKYPWSNGKARNTMKLKRDIIRDENESKLNWGPNGATQYHIINMDERNANGMYRGYRILPSEGVIHLTVENSSNLDNAANWATHDLFVTRQKDTEPRSAHQHNSQDVANPMVDFNKFFDGENLTQVDLVLWVNLGMHHIPHSGDLPNTVFTTAHSGLKIMPLNYLDSDPSRETTNQVRINYDGNTSEITLFHQKSEVCYLNFTATEPNLKSYLGDIAVLKHPYDPNNPFYDTESIV